MREEIEEARKEKSCAYHRNYSREYRARNLEKQREYDRIKAREYRAKKKAQAAAALSGTIKQNSNIIEGFSPNYGKSFYARRKEQPIDRKRKEHPPRPTKSTELFGDTGGTG